MKTLKLSIYKLLGLLDFFTPKIFNKKKYNEFKYFFLQIFYGMNKKVRTKFRKLNHWDKDQFNRVAILNFAASKFNYEIKYLEIGCDTNIVFNSLPIKKENKIGVDPVRGGNIRTTSDNFFKNNKINFDIIFIDGLHEYSQCQKDVINSLKFLNPNGIIFIHDLIPVDWKTEHCPRIFEQWNGDVWKVAFEINTSKNIKFNIIDCDNGIGMIQKDENYEYNYLNNELNNKKYNYFVENFSKLPIINFSDAIKILDKKN